MANFNWTEQDIDNSDFDNEFKNLLKSELNGEIRKNDPSNTFDNIPTHMQFKRQFYHDIDILTQLHPKMADISLNECTKYNISDNTFFHINNPNMTPEMLLEEVVKFYAFFNDKEILTEVLDLVNPNNHYLRIAQYNKDDNPICNNVRGRCFSTPKSEKVFASYYMSNQLDDITILAHEVSHMLANRLFKDQVNPIVRRFLREIESYYMELFCGYYLGYTYKDQNISVMLDNNRLLKTIEYLWHVRLQYHLYHQFGFKGNVNKLNKALKKVENSPTIDEKYLRELYRILPMQANAIIHSTLIAIDLYIQTIQDIEKGLYHYRKLMTSTSQRIVDLFKENNITYLEDDLHNFHTLYNSAKELQLSLKK